MPARFDVERRVVRGDQSVAIGTDRDWRFGPVEGQWWVKYSWWVIPLGLIALILPWLILGGVFDKTQNVQRAPVVTSPVIVQPVVVVQQATQPAPSVLADSTAGMSPEDLRLYERLVLRK